MDTELQQYLATRYPDAQFSDLKFLSQGFECDVYAFRLGQREFIIRLYLGNGGAEKAVRECSGMKRLYEMGYPVPEILLSEADDSIMGKPFIIMEKLDGQNLWPVLSVSDDAARLLKQFSSLLAQLHSLDWRAFTLDAARIEANPSVILDDVIANARRQYTEFQAEGFLKIADWLEANKPAARPAVVHLDFHANNVFLRGDGRMTVIDWSQIGVSDYRNDLAWTLQIMGDYGAPGWGDQILKAYSDVRPVPDLDYFVVMGYVKNLASTIISARAGGESMGLRADAVSGLKDDLPFIRRAAQRIREITGLTISDVEAVLNEIG